MPASSDARDAVFNFGRFSVVSNMFTFRARQVIYRFAFGA